MNNFYKILLLILLAALCAILLYTSFRANAEKLTVCPVDAISMKNGIAVVDTMRCIGCGRCALGIPSPYNLTLFPSINPAPKDTLNDSILPETEPESEAEPVIEIVKKEPVEIKKELKQKKEIEIKTEAAATPDTTMVYTIIPDKCIGCRLCTFVCPTGAITVSRRIATIDQSKCINCGVCKNGNGVDYARCPVDAISASKATE